MSVTEELELDISSALSEVDRLGSALDQAASQFRVALADAVDVLRAVEVEQVDATAVTTGIDDAISAADAVVPVEADTSPAVASLSDLASDAPVVEIPVELDTAQAQDELIGLADSAQSLSDSGDGAGAAISGIGAASGLAAGDVAGLGTAATSLTPKLAGAAAGVAVLGGATAGFFDQAVNSTAATERFTQTFGDLAVEVERVDVGNLSTTIGDLALQLGSSGSAVRNVASSFGQLGLASGATQESVAETTDQLVALSARAVALNPALGSVDEVADRMSTGLAKGGRFVADFGISLQAADINARALADTGKDTTAELTQYEKAAAGAALATEIYGDSLDEAITQGAESPIIQLQRLQREFGAATTELGKPLVVPVLDLLTEAQPIFIGFATILGNVGGALLPVLSSVVTAVQPIVSALTEVVDVVLVGLAPGLESLGPPIEHLGSVVADVTLAFVPVIGAVAELSSLFAEGLAVGIELVSDVFDALGPVLPTIALGIGAVVVAVNLLNLNPLILAGTALVTLAGALNGLGDAGGVSTEAMSDIEAQTNATTAALFGQAATLAELQAQTALTDTSWANFIATESEFVDDPGIGSKLIDTGIGLDTLRGQLSNGQQGFQDFIDVLEQSGSLKITVNGVEQTIKNFDDLTEAQQTQLLQNDDLLVAFGQQQNAVEAASQAKLQELILTGQITEAQAQEVIARQNAADGTSSYASVLQEVIDLGPQLVAANAAQVLPLDQQAAAWVSLADAVARGEVTTQNFGTVAEGLAPKLGVSTEIIGQFVAAVNEKVTALTSSIVSQIPTATAAFSGLEDATDPKKLQENLFIQALAVQNFTENLRVILAFGNAELAALLAEQGPVVGGAYAQAILDGAPGTAAALENQVGQFRTSGDELEAFVTGELGPALATDLGTVAQDSAAELGLMLDLSGAAAGPVQDLSTFLISDQTAPTAAGFAGEAVGLSFDAGMVEGIESGIPTVQKAIQDLIKFAEEAARQKAESESPSKLFARVGDDLGAGVALGLADSGASVVAAAEQVVAEAFAAMQTSAAAAPEIDAVANLTAAGGTSSPTTLVIQQLTVTVNPPPGMTPAEAEQLGAATAQGMASELSRLDISTLVRGA